jgi:glycosyltransferase involved in cell wall biosynthesis
VHTTNGHRVVVFTETFLPRVDGIVNTLKWSLRGLVEAGWEPLVVAPAGNTQSMPGVRVIGARSIVFPLYREVRLGYPTGEIWRALDAFQPDVVHLAGPVTNGFGGLKYAQSRGVPLVSSYHTTLPEYARLYGLNWLADWSWSMLRSVHNSTSATLCPSRATIADLHARGFERLELWSRGVDSTLFTPERRSTAMRARLGAAAGELLLVSVGRLAREKKLERLAQAISRVGGVHVAVIGDGPERDHLERQVFAGLPVTFVGPLYGAELAAAYASADAFVFPSDTDTFGNVVLEAMACGLPVVASAVGGQIDLVQHEQTGLLFAPHDAREFAAHLTRYRDDPGLRVQHATRGLRSARDRTWPRQVQQLIDSYLAAMQLGDHRQTEVAAA